jgi:hypothetical protein
MFRARGHIHRFRKYILAPSSGFKYVNSGIGLVIQESYVESGPTDFHSEGGCGILIRNIGNRSLQTYG